ncbi:hypothetical protein B484DRAFT_93059 [Ochromonadaceae sp. CCMP2298]|nr:hypothetical protein B484DRAFT_93059 [Ochromonadaceae sp. CCMP2298]
MPRQVRSAHSSSSPARAPLFAAAGDIYSAACADQAIRRRRSIDSMIRLCRMSHNASSSEISETCELRIQCTDVTVDTTSIVDAATQSAIPSRSSCNPQPCESAASQNDLFYQFLESQQFLEFNPLRIRPQSNAKHPPKSLPQSAPRAPAEATQSRRSERFFLVTVGTAVDQF